MEVNKSVAYHPIKVLLPFLIFTELLYFIGPIDYQIKESGLLIVYFVILNFALFAGYHSGVRNFRPTSFNVSQKTICFLLLFGLVLNVLYMIQKWEVKNLSISISSFLLALSNPGDAYLAEKVSVNTDIFTGILFTPFRWMAIPIGVFAWKQLPKVFKGIVVLTCLVHIVTWIGIGTRKGLLDLIIIVYFTSVAANTSLLTDASKRHKLVSVAISFLLIFLAFFIFSNLSRGGMSSFSELEDISQWDYRKFYSEVFNANLLAAFGEITNYLSGGYYALNVALSDIGIIPLTVGGQGFSTALYMDRFFGYDPIPDTYMTILSRENGIDIYQCWHSAYLWFANDFSFIGVPVVVFIIGKILAKTWMDSVNNQYVFSYPLFAFMAIMVFYFFANNQVISFSLEPFVGCIFIYVFFKYLKHNGA